MVEDYKIKKKEKLEEELKNLYKERDSFRNKKRYYLIVAIVLFFASIALYIIFFRIFLMWEVGVFLSILSAFYGAVFLAKSFQYYPQEIEQRIFEIQNEIDLITIKDVSLEERAEKLFRLHQIELKRYYDQTLNHSRLIFFVGIVSIFAGFVFIGVAFYLLYKFPLKEMSDKLLIGALGSIGAILSNFVAVIFVKMYSETIKSLTEFHNRLVITHYLHFSNFLVSKIKDVKLREETISDIAKSIILMKNYK